ncbi:MAG: MlaE family ABC transporter permease [Planctomycetota bacterium]|jgi:phospholipid/cholesterol/gamma-HCH transport system permease protein
MQAQKLTEAAGDGAAAAQLSFDRPENETLVVRISGSWRVADGVPGPSEVQAQLESGPRIGRVQFDTQNLEEWDTGLLIFLRKLQDRFASRRIEVDASGLPDGARRLLNLAAAVPEKKGTGKGVTRTFFLALVGEEVIRAVASTVDMVRFIGEATIALGAFVRRKASYRRSDLMLIIQECGAQALPIISLISFLVGLILAFVGAVQLLQFGAQIYVANLVGIAMVREMGAMMAAIIMAGRTGAAFAAQLGTMTVNEEIDALRTLGISPMEFLVLPRMLALILMMPLLCLYADLVGMIGGLVVGVGMLDITFVEYFNQTVGGVGLNDIAMGVVKSAVFGVLVALSGCMRGMQSGRSASAVGVAATSAVVTAIVFIIVTDAVFAVVTNIIGV